VGHLNSWNIGDASSWVYRILCLTYKFVIRLGTCHSVNCKLRKAQRAWVLRSIVIDRQTCTSTIMNDSPILHYLQRDIEFWCQVDTVWSCLLHSNRTQESRILQKSVTQWEQVRSHSGEVQRDFRQEIVCHNFHTFSHITCSW